MKRSHRTFRRLTAPLLVSALLPAQAADATAYEADIEDARWRSVSGAAACHLLHAIPLLGTAVISEDAGGGHSTTLILERPAGDAQKATVYRAAPPWKPPRRTRLRGVELMEGATTVGLGHGDSLSVVAALAARRSPPCSRRCASARRCGPTGSV